MTWPATAGGWALVALATLMLLAGLAVLYGPRVHAASHPRFAPLSTPTRMLLGILLLIAAYHAAAWAGPPSATPLQLPRRWWWVWAISGVLLVLLSLALDRREVRNSRGPGPG